MKHICWALLMVICISVDARVVTESPSVLAKSLATLGAGLSVFACLLHLKLASQRCDD